MGMFDMIGDITSGVLGYMGTKKQNKTQKEVAREQMAFQERMSGSAYQRAVADMQAAGLNPILAYSQGGASTPPGAMPQIQSELGAGVNSAQAGASALQALSNIDLQAANTDAARANADKLRSETMEHDANSAHLWSKIYNLHQQENQAGANADKIRRETMNIQAMFDGITAHSARQMAEYKEMQGRGGFAADVERRKAESRLAQLEIPRSEGQAKFFERVEGMPAAVKMLLQLMQSLSSGRSAIFGR